MAHVGHAVCFGARDFAGSPGLSRLTENYEISQALCTALVTPTLNLICGGGATVL